MVERLTGQFICVIPTLYTIEGVLSSSLRLLTGIRKHYNGNYEDREE
jgi:hypothetical protein